MLQMHRPETPSRHRSALTMSGRIPQRIEPRMNASNQNKAPGTAGGEIIALTSLRGIAAMAVVMQHFSVTAQEHSVTSIPSLVPHGYLAVDLFFMLSGFIMSYTYLASFEAVGMRAYGDFLRKRVARIVPLNVAVLCIFVIAGQLSLMLLGSNIIYVSDNLPADLLANLFMLQGLGIGRNLNGPSWSISTEFAAYFLFPLFMAAVFSRQRSIRILALVAGIAVLGWLASLHPRLSLATEDIGQGVLRCFAEFTIGMASYRLYSKAMRGASLLGSDAACFTLMAFCAFFMGMRVDLPAVLLFPLLIVSLALNQGRASRMMSNAVFYFLGLVSFSLYLLHQLFRPVELALLQAWHPAPLDVPAALLFALAGSLSVVPFAWLAYCYVERPGRAFMRRLSLWRRPAASAGIK